MICIRCGKDLGHANPNNADYVIADEFLVSEKRERFYAVNDKEEFIPIRHTTDSLLIPNVKRIEVTLEDATIQKTGVVCLDDYKDTDTLIWGYHLKGR